MLHATFWIGTAAGSQTSLDSGSNFAVGKRSYFLEVVNLGLDNYPCLSAWATLLPPAAQRSWAKMKSETTPESPHGRQEWRPLQSPHTKRGEVQPATNHATSCDSWQVLATYLNTQWHRQWLQNLALLYRKGNDANHQHAVFDRWLRRFAQRCSCRACCAGGRLVCGGDHVETMMCTIWVCARA